MHRPPSRPAILLGSILALGGAVAPAPPALALPDLVVRQDMLGGDPSWNAFLEIGARTGSLGYAFPSLRLCEELVPGTVPSSVLEACANQVPTATRRLLTHLTPANAQRLERSSIAEHFMWSRGWRGRCRQIASDLLPSSSWQTLWSIYERRAWALVRGRIRP